MRDVNRSLRIRAFVRDRYLVLVLLCVIIAAGAGWWAYQVHMVPEFEEDQQIVGEWTESTDFDHAAEIRQPNSIWDVGETVENRPLYYTNLSQDLDGTYRYDVDGQTGEVEVVSDIALVIRGINDDTVYWEYAEPLMEVEETITVDETHEVEFTIDVIDLLRQIDQIERELGAREGLIDPRVIVVTDVTGEVDDDPIEATRQSELAIVVNPDTYRIDEQVTVDERHQEVERFDVPVDPPMEAQLGSLLAFVLALFVLISLVAGELTGRFELSEDERTLLQLARERDEFDEWITSGTFPADREYDAAVLVDDLVGLVDVAIDTNNRVIEDDELGVSAVLDGDIVYVYVHPDSPARDWLLNYADTTIDEYGG